MFSLFKNKFKENSNNKKNRILFIVGFNRNNIYKRMNLEVLRTLMENPANEIFFLDCNGKVMPSS